MQLVIETQVSKYWRKNLTFNHSLTYFQEYDQQREALFRLIDELTFQNLNHINIRLKAISKFKTSQRIFQVYFYVATSATRIIPEQLTQTISHIHATNHDYRLTNTTKTNQFNLSIYNKEKTRYLLSHRHRNKALTASPRHHAMHAPRSVNTNERGIETAINFHRNSIHMQRN